MLFSEACIKIPKGGVQRASGLCACQRFGKSGWWEEDTDALRSFPAPCPADSFCRTVPELYLFFFLNKKQVSSK